MRSAASAAFGRIGGMQGDIAAIGGGLAGADLPHDCQALKEGVEKGREEEKTEIVRKMKSDGLPDDVISKYTGLPIGEIERI